MVETLIYSNKVKKFNRFDWTQERILVITNKRILNIKKASTNLFQSHFTEVQRSVNVDKLLGVTKSMAENQGEFVLHVKEEYDYRMRSDARDSVIDLVRKLYLSNFGKPLPLYGVVSASNSHHFEETKELVRVHN